MEVPLGLKLNNQKEQITFLHPRGQRFWQMVPLSTYSVSSTLLVAESSFCDSYFWIMGGVRPS